MTTAMLEKIKMPDEILENADLAPYTTFQIGGSADFLAKAENEKSLSDILQWSSALNLPVTLLGGGSNTLISDLGIRGLVIQLKGKFLEIISKETDQGIEVYAGAGASVSALLGKVKKFNCEGWEHLAGIPGSLGGAILMNAGQYGKGIGDFTNEVRTMNHEGKLEIYSKDNCRFAYRNSIFQEKNAIVLSLHSIFPFDKNGNAKQKAKEYLERRKKTQPELKKTAGSIFKNPPGDYAGRLLEICGLKGIAKGDAYYSKGHANFIVNGGQAKAEDIMKLIQEGKNRVMDRFGIKLEEEIKIIGEFR